MFETQEKKWKVNLGELCKELTKLSGGKSSEFTGYTTKIIPYWSFNKLLNDASNSLDCRETRVLRNCRVDFGLILERTGIVPNEFGCIENPHPHIYFDRLSVHLYDSLADGSHVYEHIVENGGQTSKVKWQVSPKGFELAEMGDARMIALKQTPYSYLYNVTISESAIAKLSSDKAKDMVAKALDNLSKAKTNDGGKV